MTQAQQRDYMSTFIKNQGSWKLTQLKKLTFDELKTEFEKLVKSIENFMPMETDERVKRQEPVIAKEEEIEMSVMKRGKIRKQKARKGILIDKTAQDKSKEEMEAFMIDKVTSASSDSEIGIDAIPTATKPHTILKDFSRDDLIELYRLVIKKYGANRPEEMYDRVLWGDLKTMFDPPISNDAIWNRKYPLSKDACKVMLKMKLLDGTMDDVCYQLLKMIEKLSVAKSMVWVSGKLHQEQASPKQTALCCTKALATPKQMDTGKEISNPLTVDSLLKTIRLSMHLVTAMKH
ncbi:hypothetical protein Tco_0007109 [Tanacetum coccineum]